MLLNLMAREAYLQSHSLSPSRHPLRGVNNVFAIARKDVEVLAAMTKHSSLGTIPSSQLSYGL